MLGDFPDEWEFAVALDTSYYYYVVFPDELEFAVALDTFYYYVVFPDETRRAACFPRPQSLDASNGIMKQLMIFGCLLSEVTAMCIIGIIFSNGCMYVQTTRNSALHKLAEELGRNPVISK